MFDSPIPATAPTSASELPNASSTVFQSPRTTRSNFGQTSDVLDPLSHSITQHTDITNHLLALPNISSTKHYSNNGCTTSQ